MNKPDGGPAFPLPVAEDVDCFGRASSGYGGMSLRDYFAAAALSHPYTQVENAHSNAQKTADWAYGLADAMLAERAK